MPKKAVRTTKKTQRDVGDEDTNKKDMQKKQLTDVKQKTDYLCRFTCKRNVFTLIRTENS